MNKKISFLFALVIIIGCAAIAFLLVWDYDWIPQIGEESFEPLPLPTLTPPKNETADWETYAEGKISFRYPDDIWQLKDKDFYEDFSDTPSVKTDGYFLNEKIDSCESWVGISFFEKNGYEMCRTHALKIFQCGSDEDIIIECETPKTGEMEKIELNNKIFTERTIYTKYVGEEIQVWYDIYGSKSNKIYCATLITSLDNQEQCLGDFEQILSTFRFLK